MTARKRSPLYFRARHRCTLPSKQRKRLLQRPVYLGLPSRRFAATFDATIFHKGFLMLTAVKVVQIGKHAIDGQIRHYEGLSIVESAKMRVADDTELCNCEDPVHVIVTRDGIHYGPMIVCRNVSYTVVGQRGGL